MTDSSFCIDSLLEDLRSLSDVPPALTSSHSQAASYKAHTGEGSSNGSDPASLVYLPHPPAMHKSPVMQNPKVKFAVLPDSSTNFHHKLNNSKDSGVASSSDLDHLLSMLDSPSMQTPFARGREAGTNAVSSVHVAPVPSHVADVVRAVKTPPRQLSRTMSASSWDSENTPEHTPDEVHPRPASLPLSVHNRHLPSHSESKGAWTSSSSGSAANAFVGSNSSGNINSTHNNGTNSSSSSNSGSSNNRGGGWCGTAPSFVAGSDGGETQDVLKLLEVKIHSSHPKTRCSRVVVAGSSFGRGLKASAFSKFACDCLLCVHCNFKVLSFVNRRWDSSADYLFLRNNMPNESKLAAKLICEEGCVAYCCQCASLSESKERTLVPGVATDPQWICTGH